MRIVRSAELIPVPWKNGGGITREIAGASDDRGPLWRLSLADIEADGPFSIFDGLERILTIVDGAGLLLDMPQHTVRLEPMQPYRFSGATPVNGRLPAARIRALNVMYRPENLSVSLRPLQGATTFTTSGSPGKEGAIHVVSGGATLDGTRLEAGDTVLDAAGTLNVSPAGAVVMVTFAHHFSDPLAK